MIVELEEKCLFHLIECELNTFNTSLGIPYAFEHILCDLAVRQLTFAKHPVNAFAILPKALLSILGYGWEVWDVYVSHIQVHPKDVQ